MMLGRNLYLLTLVSIVAATSSRIEVAKVGDEVNLKLTFDDNTFDDVLILQPFYLNENEKLAAEKDNCKFLGNLASDQDASVALTGCLNEEDVQITILSRKIPLQKMFFNLKLDGEIEDLTTEFEETNGKSIESYETFNRKSYVEDSVLEDCLLNLEGNISDVIPSEMTLEITLNYEETFLGSFNGNHDEAVAAIGTALTHAQAVFFDESLHTRIVLKVIGEIKFWPNEYLTAENLWMRYMRDVLFGDDDGSQADTHIMFTYGRYWKDQGIAPPEGHENDYTMGKGWLGCVCWDGMACNSIIEKYWRKTWPRGLVNTFVHEIGHNLGMKHINRIKTPSGMKDGLCYQGDGPNLKLIQGRSDWEYSHQIWSPCSRCELLGTFQCLNGSPFN